MLAIRRGIVRSLVVLLVAGCLAPRDLPSEPPGPSLSASPVAGPTGSPLVASPAPGFASASPQSSEPGQLPSPPTFTALAVIDASTVIVAGFLPNGADSGTNPTRARIWRTTDAGATWERTDYDGALVQAMASARDGIVWAVTGCPDGTCASSVLVSRDDGATWKATSDRLFAEISPINDRTVWAMGPAFPPAQPGAIARSQDGGRTWREIAVDCPLGAVSTMSFVSATHGWVGCADEPGAGQELKAIVETRDSGRTWAVRAQASLEGPVGTISASDYLEGIAMRPTGVGFMWMGRGTTVRTANGGRDWAFIPPGEFDVVLGAAGAALDDDHWFLVAWDGNTGRQVIEASDDGGTTWSVWPPLPD